MSYAEFNPVFKKMNMKPKGEVEIVLSTSLSELRGSVEALSEMIDQKIRVALESTVVTYNVQINARTEKPIRHYKVDESGIVTEVKSEGEQTEMDLGLPKEQDPVKEVPEEISREIVDDFILSLLAPQYDDLPYPFYAWVDRIRLGETYSKLASDFAMSSGKIVELIDEYRSRVAPLAAKWDEWRKSKAEGNEPLSKSQDSAEHDAVSESTSAVPGGESERDEIDESSSDDGDEPMECEKQILDGDEIPAADESSSDDLDSYILRERPSFDDIPYDFPALLERRKNGETWMQIASSLGISSSKLSAAWSKYKSRIKNSDNGVA